MHRSESKPVTLAGRDEELATLRRALSEARSGRTQVVVIDGPAGMGKSALLTEFIDNDLATAKVMWLRCDPLVQEVPFSAAQQLLGEPVGPECSELEIGRRLLARLGAGLPAPDVTVFAVDDAHWMDGPSARAFRFVIRRLRVDPLLAVITRRPGSPEVDLIATEDARALTVLRPAPLDRTAVRDLVSRVRGWRLSGTTADLVVKQTGGSPLLITSVLHHAADQAQLENWTDIPASAASTVVRMLDSLGDESRRLVEAVAVLAEPADLVTLGGIAEVTEVASRATAAVGSGLLRMDSSGAVSSSHALLREAVYESVPLDRRQALHARAAQWTSGDRRLGHRAAAASSADPALVADLITAADAARSSRRYDLAATHRLRARSITTDPAERDALLFEAVIDRVSAQDLDGADELMEQAAPLDPGPLRSLALGLLARERGRIGEARAYLHEAYAETSDSSDLHLRQRAAVSAAVLHARLNEGALTLAALDDMGDVDDPELAGDATTHRAIGLWQIGDDSGALAELDAMPISSEGKPWEAELFATRGAIHMYAGQLSEALGALDRSIELSHLWRPSSTQARIYGMRCQTRYWIGDWDGAVGDGAAARALATRAEMWSVAFSRAVSVHVPASRGQWKIAGDHLAEARAVLSSLPGPQVLDLVTRAQSAVHTARGDHQAVVDVLEPIRGEVHQEQLSPFRSLHEILPTWISSCIELGRLADAERELDRYVAMLQRWPHGPGPDRLGWLRGLLAQARGELDSARDHFRMDLADPSLSTTPFLQAQLRHAAGRLEQSTGRRREAIRHLSLAHDLFAQLRAAPFVERCRVDLAASGLRTTGTDPRALNEREEDVAALVSKGYTNKEVARALFVSEKAVEYNLRTIYLKLDIASRRELQHWRADSESASTVRDFP